MQHSIIPTSTASGDLHLSPAQVATLENAVRKLDTFLLKSVEEMRQNLWVRPETKDVVDYRLRELLVSTITKCYSATYSHISQRAVAHTFQTQPIDNNIRRARTTLLTRRVRVVLQAFNQHRSYATAIPPGIEWDEHFIPPELYPDTIQQALGEVEGGIGAEVDSAGDVDKGKGKARAMDKGKGKERAANERGTLPDMEKGKAPELAAASRTSTTDKMDPSPPSAAATKIRSSRKRKNISPETVEDSDDLTMKRKRVSGPNEDSDYEGHRAPARRLPAIKSRPKNKTVKTKQAVTIPIANLLPPPPCRRCLIRQQTCVPVGWKAACEACSRARQGCEHSKANPPPESIPPGTIPVAGSSKRIPKVKLVIPQTMHAKGSGPRRAVIVPDTSDVPHFNQQAAGSSRLPLSAPDQSGIRRVTPAGPTEPRSKFFFMQFTMYATYLTDVLLVLNSTTVSSTTPDLNTLLERIQEQDVRMREQDRRIREVEASDIASRGLMVTQEQLREKDREIRTALTAMTDELHKQSRRIERKLDSCTEGDVKSLLARMVGLGEEVASIGEALDGQDKHMREELQATERRWERHVNEQEQRLEAMIEETDTRLQREIAQRVDTMSERVDEALVKISERNLQAPWERRIEEAALGWQKELESAMAARPTREEFTGYTTLVTTEKICNQLATLQLRTAEQFNDLQGDLHTVERLYLRQLDQGGDVVSLLNEVSIE